MRNRNGFTLIELLVVMAIISILAGLLLPGVMRAMKQAKSNRALSEMQHLATVITQIYSEVGYYVQLEDLVKTDSGGVLIWARTTSPPNGQSDADLTTINDSLNLQPTGSMWNGPYTTYKSYYNSTLQNYTGDRFPIPSNVWDVNSIINTPLINAPLDPWGRPYRMFWITNALLPDLVPVGAKGAMVIISAGGDGIMQSLVGQEQRPTRAQQADFNAFNPNDSAITEKDVYYIFNAGIQ